MAETNQIERTVSYESFPCVGTVGAGLFPADFSHAGKPVLFSGAIRVHRTGSLKDSGRYFFECYVYGPNSKIGDTEDPSKAIWYDEAGNEATPVHGTGPVQLATEDDYYGRILPTIKRLERSIPSAAPTDELTPYRVGLVDCWQWRK